MSYRKLPTFRRLPVFSALALALLFPGPCPAVPGDVENRWAPVQITGEITTVAYHPEDGLWVGGNAEIIKARAHKHLLRLVPNGFKDSTAIPAMGNPVSAIQMLPDRRLLFASSTSSKVRQSSGMANNGFDTAFAAASPALVNTIGITPERDFLLGRAVAPSLMKISASGVVDAAYASSLTAPVLSLAVLPDGACLPGGGLPAGSGFLTKVSAIGVTDPSFAPVFDGAVLAIVIQPDGKILAGDRFLTVNSPPCTGLVRLLPDGSV